MTIDIFRFTRIPNLSIKQMLRLAKTLIADKPKQSNEVIELATSDLQQHIVTVDDALTARLQATNAELLQLEGDFDRAVDGLWVYTRRVVEGAAVYGHQGLDALPEELAKEAELDEARAEAERAQHLYKRLFGPGGTDFVQFSYIEQAESMAALHRVIEQEGLYDELVAVVGPRLPRLLQACQRQYEDMVNARLGRHQNLVGNLRELRSDLRWYIVQYNTAVISLVRRGEPETLELVEHALRSVITVRRASLGGSELPSDEELEELEELIGDEEPKSKPALEDEG